MEMWILLAAAGSGYLAKCWQNAQRSKGATTQEVERISDCNSDVVITQEAMLAQNGDVDHSSHKVSGPIRSFLESRIKHDQGRRVLKDQADTSPVSGRGDNSHDKGKVPTDGTDSTLEALRIKDEASEAPLVDSTNRIEDHDRVEVCKSAFARGIAANLSRVDTFAKEGTEDVTLLRSLAKSIPFEHRPNSTGEGTCIEREISVDSVNSRVTISTVLPPQGTLFANGSPSQLKETSLAGNRSTDCSKDAIRMDGGFFHDGVSGTPMKDAFAGRLHAGKESILDGYPISGFWDHLQSFHFMMPEGESRSRGSISKKVKTPQKYGRSKGALYRRKSLTTSKPMSSLESCLSAQLIQDSYNTARRGTSCSVFSPPQAEQPLVDSARNGESPSSIPFESMSYSTRGDTAARSPGIVCDCVVGLPPLSKCSNGNGVMSKQGNSKKNISNNSLETEDVCIVPSREQVRLRELEDLQQRKARQHYRGSSVLGNLNELGCQDKGHPGSSLDGLLFNFGVGVGMMFVIISNKKEVKRLTELLRQTQGLVKDLEQELEVRDVVATESFRGGVLGDVLPEIKQAVVLSILKKVKHLSQLWTLYVHEDNESAVKLEPRQSKEMANLEAELEAELERMQSNLNGSNNQSKVSGLNEVDSDIIADFVHGILRVNGLSGELERDLEGDDCHSTHEEVQANNYAVSPRELERRLHEVVESRLEERIAQLEAELDAINRNLKVKEEELQQWKGNVCQNLDPTSCMNSGEDFVSELLNSDGGILSKKSMEMMAGTMGMMDKQDSLDSSGLQGDSLVYSGPACQEVAGKGFELLLRKEVAPISFKASKVYEAGSLKDVPSFTTLYGDALAAYYEAYDESLNISSDIGMRSNLPSIKSGFACMDDCCSYDKISVSSLKDLKVYNHDLVYTPIFDHLKAMDLLASVKNSQIGNTEAVKNSPTYVEDIDALPKESTLGFIFGNRLSTIGMESSHQEDDHLLDCSELINLDDAAHDTSGSTPCSIKCIDARVLATHVGDSLTDPNGKTSTEICSCNDDCFPPFWDHIVSSHAGTTTTPLENDLANRHGMAQVQNKGMFVDAGTLAVCKTSCLNEYNLGEDQHSTEAVEESEYVSDSDERIGKLLINRILEKARSGSPIIQEAQTVLASMERDDLSSSSHSSDIISLPQEEEKSVPWHASSEAGQVTNLYANLYAGGQETLFRPAQPFIESSNSSVRRKFLQN